MRKEYINLFIVSCIAFIACVGCANEYDADEFYSVCTTVEGYPYKPVNNACLYTHQCDIQAFADKYPNECI